MRKLKFTLNRKSLNQIYLSYVVPLLEYASIVWDGCSDSCANSLQKLQNKAARIVIGLTRSVSLENLFLECGWQSLKDRWETQKMFFMYKATHQMVPQYGADLIPPIIADTTQYALGNIRDLRNISTRTTISQKSCIPSSVYIWNNLNGNLKNVDSFSTFIKLISSRSPLPLVPSYTTQNLLRITFSFND